MIISNKIEKLYSFLINSIKNEENKKLKKKLIGSLVMQLGKRSINAVSKILGNSWSFIKKCYLLVKNNSNIERKQGSGRKKTIDIFTNIIIHIKEILNDYERTDSHFKTEVLFVDISIKNLKNELINRYDDYKEKVPSNTTLWRLLKQLGYKIKKVERSQVQEKVKETDAIFENVFETLKFIEIEDETVSAISIDDKARKLIGNLSDKGKSWFERKALDHDTKYDYAVIPFGILDLKTNETFITCTLGKSTAEFKVDSIDEYIIYKKKSKNIKRLIIFLDNGPENSGRRTLWLERLVELAKKHNITIELVYYPPYHSKYNKIERYWARLSLSWNGTIIDSLPKLVMVMNKVTWNGIKTKAKVSLKEYDTKIKIDSEEMEKLEKNNIHRDKILKKWSIVITP